MTFLLKFIENQKIRTKEINMFDTDEILGQSLFLHFLELLASHDVSLSEFSTAVYVSVMESVGEMPPGFQFTTKELCGDLLWSHWSTNELHRAMELCLSFLVAAQLVPLVCTTPCRKRKNLYTKKLPNN
jgi:hypothetical protein